MGSFKRSTNRFSSRGIKFGSKPTNNTENSFRGYNTNEYTKRTYSRDRYQRSRPYSRQLPNGLLKILLLALALLAIGFFLSRLNFGKSLSDSKLEQLAADSPGAMQSAELEAVSPENGNRYFRRQLGGKYLTVYDQICYGLQNHLDTIEFEIDNRDKFPSIYRYVLWDYPELFWANSGYRYSYSTLKGFDSVSLSPNYELSAEQAQQRITFVEAKVAKVAAQYEGLSEYEMVKGVYEYLINNTVYDSSYYGKSVFELLSEGRAVCSGYARTAQYVLQRLGVEAVYVEGYATNFWGNTESHAWLKVLIDGEYYNVDVTWGDPVNADGIQSLSYAYLCVTDGDISSSHVADPNPYPPCKATRYNYFVMENRMLSTYDEQLLLIWFSEDLAAGKKLEFRAINDAVYKQTLSKLFDEGNYYDIASQVRGLNTNGFSYTKDDIIKVISIY